MFANNKLIIICDDLFLSIEQGLKSKMSTNGGHYNSNAALTNGNEAQLDLGGGPSLTSPPASAALILNEATFMERKAPFATTLTPPLTSRSSPPLCQHKHYYHKHRPYHYTQEQHQEPTQQQQYQYQQQHYHQLQHDQQDPLKLEHQYKATSSTHAILPTNQISTRLHLPHYPFQHFQHSHNQHNQYSPTSPLIGHHATQSCAQQIVSPYGQMMNASPYTTSTNRNIAHNYNHHYYHYCENAQMKMPVQTQQHQAAADLLQYFPADHCRPDCLDNNLRYEHAQYSTMEQHSPPAPHYEHGHYLNINRCVNDGGSGGGGVGGGGGGCFTINTDHQMFAATGFYHDNFKYHN